MPSYNHPSEQYGWAHRPQDRWGFVPEVLFETGRNNAGRQTSKSRRTQLVRSYLPDWVITAVLCALFYALDKVHGFHRQFDITDTSIQHTYTEKERVPVWLLGVVACLVPALIMGLTSTLLIRSFWDAHNSLLGLLLTLSLTATATNVIKITVGRPRPDLLARCLPASGSANAQFFGLSTESICTTTDAARLNEGFRSFPSGHSSFAWSGLGFFALWIAGKLHLLDRRGHTLKAWIAMTPLLGAALIAVSRTMDYRHHWHDVLVGSLLGFVLGWLCYRFYYPPLHHPSCHKPYGPRIPSSEQALPHDDAGHELEGRGKSGYSPDHANGLDGTVERPMQGTRDAPVVFTGASEFDSFDGDDAGLHTGRTTGAVA